MDAQPSWLGRLLRKLGKDSHRPAETLDAVGPATRYGRRDGMPRGSYGHQADHTMILQNRPLLTRGQAWRADHAMRNQRKGGYR